VDFLIHHVHWVSVIVMCSRMVRVFNSVNLLCRMINILVTSLYCGGVELACIHALSDNCVETTKEVAT